MLTKKRKEKEGKEEGGPERTWVEGWGIEG